jgi:hypothetical protein
VNGGATGASAVSSIPRHIQRGVEQRRASNPGRTKELRIENFAGQQAPRPEKAKEKPTRLREMIDHKKEH